MSHFGIMYVDYNIAPEEVKDAFRKENAGPGQLLGYRSMQKKIREEQKLTGWVRQKGPTVIGICCCGDPALVGKAK
jgi:hypothetical protein